MTGQTVFSTTCSRSWVMAGWEWSTWPRTPRLNRRVALSSWPNDRSLTPLARERFEREARAARRAQSPQQGLHVYGLDSVKAAFIAMELLEGRHPGRSHRWPALAHPRAARSSHPDRRPLSTPPLEGHRPSRHQSPPTSSSPARPGPNSRFGLAKSAVGRSVPEAPPPWRPRAPITS